MSTQARTGIKFTLSNDKVVVIKKPINKDIENAMKLASQQVSDTEGQVMFSYKMQEILLKEVLHSVNGDTDVRKDLDELFDLDELNFMKRKLQEIAGMGNGMKATQEVVTL